MLVSCDLLGNVAGIPNASRTAASMNILVELYRVPHDDKYTRDVLCHAIPRLKSGSLGNANAINVNYLL